ncbi:MAG: flagellin [Roseburia sp.]|nr:flagellin [Roseburia sp.]
MRFKVDSVEYTIQLTEGEHTTEELLDEINAQFLAVNAPLVAEMEDNVLKISHNKVGKHSITGVSGLAKDELFFNENGDTTPHKDIMIQLSANPGDGFAIKKPIVNTAFLKINSLAITKPKYANKALMRLDGAIARVSDIRSTYGSEQNRLEHTIANNMNTAENTQNAESRIRDTDMAEEMVNNARTTILEQAAMAMQAQSKQMTEGILQLLQ